MSMARLIDYKADNNRHITIKRPKTTERESWPPDYNAIYNWRSEMLKRLSKDPDAVKAAKIYYSTHLNEFIMDWMDTYDPRVPPPGKKWMPFVFFKRQDDVIEFFDNCIRDQENGLVEKCRDFGLSWLACAYSVAAWLFVPDIAIGWGSRKEPLVDKPGDPDSLFEKMRLLIKRLPIIWRPRGFTPVKHSTFMKLINPETGSIISGEAGDNIGRGGRKSIYFLDEAAHIERAEKVEAALGDNTNVRIDISSVNGVGNVFHRRREHGVLWQRGVEIDKGFVRVFVADWRDHPLKNQEWYDIRKAKYEREGMAHIFAQEVDRSYTASIGNVIISYEWINAAVDAHIHIPIIAAALPDHQNEWMAGLDVADEGGDRNALTIRQWIVWRSIEEWAGKDDPGLSARKAIMACKEHSGKIKCQYDCIGVGSGVKTEYNRLIKDGIITKSAIPFIPWNAGASVLRPFERIIPNDNESLQNKDFFDNLKAQAWWALRTRFYKTYKARTEGAIYPVDELISLDSRMPLLEQLKKELTQATTAYSSRLKMLVDKKPNGMKSPNLADSGVQAFFPVIDDSDTPISGNYGV